MIQDVKEIIPRILRDMNDGVLVLDRQGQILFLNEQGRKMLGESQDMAGRNYAAAFLEQDLEEENDAFHQFVLDAVYDKEHAHSGEADYKARNEKTRRFSLTSSFLRSVCLYLFLWSLLRYLNAEPPTWVMTLLIEAISIVMFVIILKTTSFSIKDIGLRITNARGTFLPDILITAAGTALLIFGKIILLRVAPGFFPEGAPFWDWSVGTPADVIYPLTVILQEFLARGVMQESLNRIFTGKYAVATSIVVSALVFGVLHIAHGLPYMLGATLLLGVLGIFYHKQGNIWGLCIIHYVLGEVATFLRYLI